MKAEELMIGDLVTFKDCQNDEVKTIIKIWGLNSEGDAFAFIDGFDALDEIQIDDDIVGIPLTPEILKNNGFSTSRTGAYWEDKYSGDSVSVEIEPWKFYVTLEKNDCSLYVPLNYIHELQHALRLCGIDKEITV